MFFLTIYEVDTYGIYECSREDESPVATDEPLDTLRLSCRAHNCLESEGIETIGQLLGWRGRDLLEIRNFGVSTLEEVCRCLATHGWHLRGTLPGDK